MTDTTDRSTRELRATALSVAFAGLRAVDDVDLVVRDDEILGLIGPNGAGKTTLVNSLTGFQACGGRLEFDGVDATGWIPRRRARAGLRRTFQNVRLFKDMTVAENVEVTGLGLGLRRSAARAEARHVLQCFDLAAEADRPAGSLPYGLERRLGIARVLVASPRYVLLDEPAAGLDENESDELLEQLRSIPSAFGCGLMVIEHDMRLIMRLCDRLHVINYGTTLAVGSVHDVRTDPAVIEAYLGSATHESTASRVAHG
ncbi:ABC transporter ATP-binding protein [Desertimonas flava]|uniref:ABC transporter ATP-binding protein n=1 Tax=Desertimonas flava TaxID=2064846 RepID=UPI000E35509C|nr:ATP-binding cassette domain-containing protein [Desertimonas flava]